MATPPNSNFENIGGTPAQPEENTQESLPESENDPTPGLPTDPGIDPGEITDDAINPQDDSAS